VTAENHSFCSARVHLPGTIEAKNGIADDANGSNDDDEVNPEAVRIYPIESFALNSTAPNGENTATAFGSMKTLD